MTPFALPIAFAGCVAVASTATTPIDSTRAADALYREGQMLLRAGQADEACRKFVASANLERAPGTLWNLAGCHERAGRLVEAMRTFEEAAAGLRPADERRAVAKKRVEALDKRVPKITFVRAQGVSGDLGVVVDGEPAGIGVAVRVNPGEHAVVVRAAGHEDHAVSLNVESGETRELGIAPGPAIAKAVAPPPPPAKTIARASTFRHDAAMATIGMGGVAIAVGAVTGILAAAASAQVRNHCVGDACDPDGVSAASRGKTYAIASTVAFAAGLAAAGTGVVLLLTEGSKEVAIAPVATAGGAGGSLQVRF